MNFYEFSESISCQDSDESNAIISLPVTEYSNSIIKVQYRQKHVRRINIKCFASSGHTGLLINPKQDSVNGVFSGTLLVNGLSYRDNAENAALDKSIKNSLSSSRVFHISNVDKPAVIVGGTNNYGHFIFEFLPKIVQSLVLFGTRYPLIVNESIKRWLDLANIISSSIIDELPTYLVVPDGSRLVVDDCILVESTRAVERDRFIWSDKILRVTRDSALKGRTTIHNTSPRLYLCRPRDSHRSIENREEIRRLCEQRGFSLVEMGKLSQAQQLDLLANCSCIIIEGGADSMAGSLCPQYCKIIDLLPEGMLGGFGSLSSHLALNQRYIRVYGRTTSVNKGRLQIDNDYMINLDLLNHVLNREL